jgi:hypothetical protein
MAQEVLAPMHDQSTTYDEDQRDETAVFVHVVETYPDTLRLSDLIRELGDPEDFSERDRTERAVRELVSAGLLFRSEAVVLPTRTALRAYELLAG